MIHLLATAFVFLNSYALPYHVDKSVRGAIIQGHFSRIKNDTLTLLFFPEKFGVIRTGSNSQKKIIHNGSFRFTIPIINKPGYFILYSSSLNKDLEHNLYLDSYIIEPGDNIKMEITEKNIIKFSGMHAEKYRCLNTLDTIRSQQTSNKKLETVAMIKEDISSTLESLGDYSFLLKKLRVLEGFKKDLAPLIYEMIKCDLICSNVRDRYNFFGMYWPLAFELADSIIRKKKMIDFFRTKMDIEPDVSKDAKRLSANYSDLKVIRASMDLKIQKDSASIQDAKYAYQQLKIIDTFYREKILTTFLLYLSYGHGYLSVDSCRNDAIEFMHDQYYSSLLEDVNKKISKGSIAYDFKLTDMNNRKVSLSEFKGKVVLMDFWFTGCDACISCAGQLQKVINNFSENNKVVFLSISIDKNKSTWSKSVESGHYASPEREINLFTNGLGTDYPMMKYYGITSFPTLLLIDKKGNIYSSTPPRPDGYNGIEKLTAMIYDALGKE